MGGTSTDISLIVGGQPSLATGRKVAGHAIAFNSLEIASIGAGGIGTLARLLHPVPVVPTLVETPLTVAPLAAPLFPELRPAR